jgi:hypothetical protein
LAWKYDAGVKEDGMPDFGELLQAATREANVLVLFIPSADREGNALGGA